MQKKKDCCSHDEWTAGLTKSEADMYFHIMTLFPEMVLGGLNESITGKAIEKGLIGVDAVNIRDLQVIGMGTLMIIPMVAVQVC